MSGKTDKNINLRPSLFVIIECFVLQVFRPTSSDPELQYYCLKSRTFVSDEAACNVAPTYTEACPYGSVSQEKYPNFAVFVGYFISLTSS